tara:strand:- start:391 stop:1230 length:840 start_codon:yes stop_codon:yes gene_type:complete
MELTDIQKKLINKLPQENIVRARVIEQSLDIMQITGVVSDSKRFNEIIDTIFVIYRHISECDKSIELIIKELEEISKDIDKGKYDNKDTCFLSLESSCEAVLQKSKLIIDKIHKIPSILFDDVSYHNFNMTNLAKNFEDKYGKEHILVKMISNDYEIWAKRLYELRDAIEHTKNKEIKYIHMEKVSHRHYLMPQWYISYIDKEDEEPTDILHALDIFFNNMLKYFEDVFAVCCVEYSGLIYNLGIKVIPEEERNEKCPKRIELQYIQYTNMEIHHAKRT